LYLFLCYCYRTFKTKFLLLLLYNPPLLYFKKNILANSRSAALDMQASDTQHRTTRAPESCNLYEKEKFLSKKSSNLNATDRKFHNLFIMICSDQGSPTTFARQKKCDLPAAAQHSTSCDPVTAPPLAHPLFGATKGAGENVSSDESIGTVKTASLSKKCAFETAAAKTRRTFQRAGAAEDLGVLVLSCVVGFGIITTQTSVFVSVQTLQQYHR
jgi:hypothetical protein